MVKKIRAIIYDIKDGKPYENQGVATNVSDGGTITHGLTRTPNYGYAICTVAGEFASITAFDSTTMTVAIKKHDGSPGTTQTIYWFAGYKP